MSDVAALLLPWFERHGRKNLPWQQQASAYRVWLSEIMLQQTQVKTVIPYFERFVASFADIQQLANAELDEVLQHWAGLGYYARARNLHRAAQLIRDEYDGHFPRDIEALVALPGIGRSTAGAIASFAFAQPAAILDGNVKRVLCRVFAVEGWPGHSGTLKILWQIAEHNTPQQSTAEYNQAMMDLGALVCKRSCPDCDRCPLTLVCQSYRLGTQAQFPQPRPRKDRPKKHRWMLLHRQGGRLLMQRRPAHGIWGGLWSLPELENLDTLSEWQMQQAGQQHAASVLSENLLTHAFSHFDLSISLAEIQVSREFAEACQARVNEEDALRWISWQDLPRFGLPAPVQKILAAQPQSQ